MSCLANPEKLRLEKALSMEGGWVLGFKDRSFSEFFLDCVGINIFEPKYAQGSGSKAHRMRAFFRLAEPKQVVQCLEALLAGWDVYSENCAGADRGTLEAVAARLRRNLLHKTVSSTPAPKRIQDMRFSVALSFPGQCRGYVEQISNRLKSDLGSEKVFYDLDFQAQLARPDLDTLLQHIYRTQSDLIVVFLSSDYANSQWCGLEWRAIRDIIKQKKNGPRHAH